MRSPLQPRVARPLVLRHELGAVAIAAGGVLAAFFAGALAGRVPPEGSLELRAAWVLALAALGPIAGWAYQNESEPRVRALPALLVTLPVLHLLVSGSALLATLDVLVVLGASAVVLVRAIFRISTRRHGSPPARRMISASFLFLALPGPLGTLGWGLVASVALPATVRIFHQSPALFVEGERFVEIEAVDHVILRGSYTEGEPGRPGVVLVHGYNDSRWRMAAWAALLASRGASVLRFDHRAQGVSDGVVCTFTDREGADVVSAARWLAAQPGVGPVSALGTSMGGGAILASLPEASFASIVLLAPASDFAAIVGAHFPPQPLETVVRSMVWGVPHAMGHESPLGLVPRRSLDHVRVATTVVHGRHDRTIPPALTEALVAAHPEVEVIWLEDATHDGTPRAAREDPRARAAILARLGLSEP